jgi:hypothetical protein
MAILTKPLIVRNERGLALAGTRLTLYDVMDYLKAGYPERLIAEKLRLTTQQVTEAVTYIHAHHDEVEAEYQQVLQLAGENRSYWDKVRPPNADSVAHLTPEQERLRAKLEEWKTRLESSH